MPCFVQIANQEGCRSKPVDQSFANLVSLHVAVTYPPGNHPQLATIHSLDTQSRLADGCLIRPGRAHFHLQAGGFVS